MQSLNKKSIVLGVTSTLLIGSVTAIAVKIFTPTIFFHRQFFTGPWAVFAFLLIIPGVITTVGMALRKIWSLPLAALLALSISILASRYLILNYKGYLEQNHEDFVFLATVIFIFISLFLILSLNSGVKQYFNYDSDINSFTNYILKHRLAFICCLLLLILFQIYTVQRYLYYQQYPWPPPEIANQEIHKQWPFFVIGKIRNEDIKLVVQVVKGIKNIDQNILYVIQKNDETVVVITGELVAPLWGSGNEIRLKKENNVWKVIGQSEWLS